MGLFILVKRKGTKDWVGAIPARKGVSSQKLRLLARQQVKRGFTFRIVNGVQLKRLLLRLGKKGVSKLRVRKALRRVKSRRKRSRKKKR